MGFLKIGDLPAGAINSGGTTLSAAKMVFCDADHPHIVNFITWKVKDLQSVASFVAGSIIHDAKLTSISASLLAWHVIPQADDRLAFMLRLVFAPSARSSAAISASFGRVRGASGIRTSAAFCYIFIAHIIARLRL